MWALRKCARAGGYALLALLLTGAAQADQDPQTHQIAQVGEKKIIIASGGTTGVYYPVAVAICRLVNADYAAKGFKCIPETSGGSVENLKRLRAGAINFAIVQSDWQAHALSGSDRFAEFGPHDELRSVFALYSESFTVLASSDSFVEEFDDLLGKRVNIGNPGSGQRATMEVVMEALGWTRFSFSLIREFDSKAQAEALCDDEVDVIVFVAGHPSGSIKSATEKCDTKLVKVAGPKFDELVDQNDFYRSASIPADMYRNQPADIPTFGVNATLVTTSETDPNLVGLVVKSVFNNMKKFKKMHPALGNLQEDEMKKDIMPAPLHDSAKGFFELN